MAHAQLWLILACMFGFFMAWGIGANDVANAMGTSVGAKALTITQALFIAAIFESLGAVVAGGEVTQTIRSGIVDPTLFANAPQLLVYGMLASLLAAGSWLIIASYFGWPVSTTHSIVGAIVGFAWFELGYQAVNWSEIFRITLSWIITPFIAGTFAYFLFISILNHILNTDRPLRNAQRYLPLYIVFTVFVLTMVTCTKGLSHLNLNLTWFASFAYSMIAGISAGLLGVYIVKRLRRRIDHEDRDQLRNEVERVFGILMIFTACAMAFAHGSNDIANAIGPLAAVVGIVYSGGDVTGQSPIPIWILFFGAIGMITGLATMGHRVIATVGSNITELTPSRGFAATIATASTVVFASGVGLPVSTTQTLVGAILGVGFARGIQSLNLKVISNIFLSWVITLPAGAILSILFFSIFVFIFG